MTDGFELPNVGKTGKRPWEILPSGFKTPEQIEQERGTLPAGFKIDKKPSHVHKVGILPKGFDSDVGDPGYYAVKTICDNCRLDVSVGIRIGINKIDGLKKSYCPKCGCKVYQTNWRGVRKSERYN